MGDLATDVAIAGLAPSRMDGTGRFREEVAFFGPSGGRRFGWRALPTAAPVGGVVVCSTILADGTRHYRREVLLGRTLAAAGFAVQRFHYVGQANSDGFAGEATFDSMRDDTLAAADELRKASGILEPLLLGIGWGGLIAAAAVRSTTTPLALWQPALDASAFFESGIRARAVRDLKEGRETTSSMETLVAELRRTGTLDVLGYSIERSLFESSAGVRLEPLLLETPRSILLLQVDRRKALSREHQALTERLIASGCRVETGWIEAEERSWFIDNEWHAEENRASTRDLLDRTTAWMTGIYEGGSGR